MNTPQKVLYIESFSQVQFLRTWIFMAGGKYFFAEQVSVHSDANNSETSEHS